MKLANKPLRPCNHPGCIELVGKGYCEAHTKKEQESKYDKSLLKTAQWQRLRARYLQQHPFCVRCEAAGRLVLANVVDHIMSHRGDSTLFWDVDNWQSLCKRCHDIKTAKEDGGFGYAAKSSKP